MIFNGNENARLLTVLTGKIFLLNMAAAARIISPFLGKNIYSSFTFSSSQFNQFTGHVYKN